MMRFLKRNYGWMIVAILAIFPLIPLSNGISTVVSEGIYSAEGTKAVAMLYHISGEFAIRWMTAVLTCTPFFILFGINNLFVRQAMGISTALWSCLHFILFIWSEGFSETFTQVNYVVGFVAVLVLLPLLFTSNRKAMKWLKSKWKKLQRFAYVAIVLSLLHVAILEKTWLIYALIIALGAVLRIPMVRKLFISRRHTKTS